MYRLNRLKNLDSRELGLGVRMRIGAVWPCAEPRRRVAVAGTALA